MTSNSRELLSIWGDSVDFKELLIGMLIGAIVGFLTFYGGTILMKSLYPDMGEGLRKGYSLLIGVTGCLAVGAGAAVAFKPKRIFREDSLNIDESTILKELNIDLEQEMLHLHTVPADVIAEMHTLGLYELFYGTKTTTKEGVNDVA